MRLDALQQARLEQRMKLAPRMIQAMEILQLPLMALQERIEAELVSNPVLEVGQHDETPAAPDLAPEPPDAERALVIKDNDSQAEDFQRLDSFDAEFEPDVWSGDAGRPARDTGERDRKLDAMANTPAPEQSLYEYLLDQWAFVEALEPVRHAGRVIIEHVDEDGYLRDTLESLVSTVARPVKIEHLRSALPLVQRLDPVGVAARDLKECLLVQLQTRQRAGEDVSLQIELVRSFLRDIEMNHLPLIARKTGHSVERIKHAIEDLSRLNPRPGSIIGHRPAPAIMPDLIVELDEHGDPVVMMTDGQIPPLHISRMYRKMVRDGKTLDAQAKEYLVRNMRSAQWLISAIQQRRHTVLRVAEEVFKVQKEFFEHGPAALKPLPMADVAAKVGVHIATISRAVAGKYVQTPRGIFPLRMFFSGGTTSQSGEDLAWDAVRAKLQEIISGEDKSNPLSDDELVESLKKQGIEIARRTVAKYRGLMNIPPARQRKRY